MRITLYLPEQSEKSGALEVTGKNDVKILLGHIPPTEVEVQFIENCNIATCNLTFDEVKFKVIKESNVYYLIISWDVQDTRTILWEVFS